MRSLILKMSITLDGFVCGPKGELDWFMKTRSPDGIAWLTEKFAGAGAHLMGHTTFTSMAAFWPTSMDPIAKYMNELPKIAFSKEGFDPASAGAWSGAKVMSGDLANNIRELKKQDGKPLLAHGGASFGQCLVETGLIDEFWLVTHPVALGQGRSLFTQLKTPKYLKLIETKPFSAGSIANIYRSEG